MAYGDICRRRRVNFSWNLIFPGRVRGACLSYDNLAGGNQGSQLNDS